MPNAIAVIVNPEDIPMPYGIWLWHIRPVQIGKWNPHMIDKQTVLTLHDLCLKSICDPRLVNLNIPIQLIMDQCIE
ncbi:hypothetical protein D3C85_1616900 [compost metagenome]